MNFGFTPSFVVFVDNVSYTWARKNSSHFSYYWDDGSDKSGANYGSFRTTSNGFQYKINSGDNGWVFDIYAIK